MAALIAADGDVVTHDRLYQQVWGRRVVQRQDGLHRLIRDIHTALSDADESKTYLHNVPGVGYKFASDTHCDSTYSRSTQKQQKWVFMSGFLAFPVEFIAYCLMLAQVG